MLSSTRARRSETVGEHFNTWSVFLTLTWLIYFNTTSTIANYLTLLNKEPCKPPDDTLGCQSSFLPLMPHPRRVVKMVATSSLLKKSVSQRYSECQYKKALFTSAFSCKYYKKILFYFSCHQGNTFNSVQLNILLTE